MSVKEYNEILYPDLLLKIEGFQNRREYDEKMLRKIGFSAYIAPNLDPKRMSKSESTYWPMIGDRKEKQGYQFQDKKEAFRELLDQVQHGASRN